MPDGALYPELKITVQNDGTVIAENPQSGEKADDGKVDDDKLLLETLRSFRDWINQGKLNITLEREFEVLGGLLRRLLLERGGSKVRDFVDKKLAEARSDDRRICVQLEFSAGQADLHSLPWEFLYDSGGKCFFATNNHLVLTRFIPGGGERRALTSNALPLRLQLVVSKPLGLKSVAASDAIKAIEKFAGEHKERIELGPRIDDLPFLPLQDRLKELKEEGGELQLAHFIGHGRYNKAKRQGEVALPNTKRDGADWIDQNQFTRLFTDINYIPRLLFLQLCEGAFVEDAELIASFEGLAPALLKVGVQAVVAMQFPIKNVHAGEICRTFYDKLTAGGSVGEAVQMARRRMVIDSPVAAGTPVLYMFGFDRPLVVAPSPGARSTGGSQGGTDPGPQTLPPKARSRQGPSQPREDAAGGSPGGNDSGPQTARQARSSQGLSQLREGAAGGGQATPMGRALAAGDRMIKTIKEGIPTRDMPAELLSLNKRLYFEVVPALKDKSVEEMKTILLELNQHEAGTLLSEVLEAMIKALDDE